MTDNGRLAGWLIDGEERVTVGFWSSEGLLCREMEWTGRELLLQRLAS